jgi:hypothetical protein
MQVWSMLKAEAKSEISLRKPDKMRALSVTHNLEA